MQPIAHIWNWLMGISQPKKPLVAMVAAPFAGLVGTLFASCGVIIYNSARPDRTTDLFVKYGIYGVMAVLVVSAVSLALWSMILLHFLMFRAVRWSRGSGRRPRRSSEKTQPVGTSIHEVHDPTCPSSTKITPMRKHVAEA